MCLGSLQRVETWHLCRYGCLLLTMQYDVHGTNKEFRSANCALPAEVFPETGLVVACVLVDSSWSTVWKCEKRCAPDCVYTGRLFLMVRLDLWLCSDSLPRLDPDAE